MDIASRFNETGVKLFHKGQGDEAFEMFHASLQVMLRTTGKTTAQMDPAACQVLGLHDVVQRALSKDQLLRDRCQLEESLRNQDVQHHNQGNSLGQHPVPPLTSMDVDCDGLSNTSLHQLRFANSSEQDPCLYNRVFRHPSTYNHDFQQYVVAIATDLYNMGLVLQRGHVLSRMSNCMERAIVLYSFAGELLWNHLGYTMLITDREGGAGLSKLYCGILNNTGYLLHQIGQFDLSQVFFQRLYQFLELLGPARDNDEQQERDTFQLNVVVLYRTLTTAGAA